MLPGNILPALLVAENGRVSPIPRWDIAPKFLITDDLPVLSLSGNGGWNYWHHIPISKCTVIGCLHAAGVSPWSNLTYIYAGRNMEIYRNDTCYKEPWLFRQEFSLNPGPGKHFSLESNGITPKADIFLNGHQIATKEFQAGSYGGHTYDITNIANKSNAVVVKVHPTDYTEDLAQSFNDWNQSPVDHSSGIWRDITLKQTGSVSLGPLSITTQLGSSNKPVAKVSLRTLARNLENRTITIQSRADVLRKGFGFKAKEIHIKGGYPLEDRMVNRKDVVTDVDHHSTSVITLPPYASRELKLDLYLSYTASDIWWPRQWGHQPLFRARLNVSVNDTVSDSRKATFGLRRVTSHLNKYKDRVFEVNGVPFQVLGTGYAPDLLLRWNATRFTQIAEYIMDIGLNTIRLEGKMEQPELYEICDRLGIMVLPGWECCDKWEAWSYNHDLPYSSQWSLNDYDTANSSIRHEAAMLQTHPSILGFMVGSDLQPDDKATAIYVEGLKSSHWDTPIISSASKRGYPKQLGPSGMKMDGPYDWVPPSYWYDSEPSGKRLGAAFGFGSELGAGVGTPELGSLLQFLDWSGVNDLWKQPNKTEYHMSPSETFSTRRIYNDALWHRYGPPTSTSDYLLKAQMMDYEATRAQFEAYSAKWDAKRPATGMVYWMLNNAWPSLQWNLFDYYMQPAGSYFGAKTGNRIEHLAYDYFHRAVYLINHSVDRMGPRKIEAELIDLESALKPKHCPASNTFADVPKSTPIFRKCMIYDTRPNTSLKLFEIKQVKKIKDVGLLRLVLIDEHNTVLSRNVYWVSSTIDKLDWKNSDWFYTPVKKYAAFTSLSNLKIANVSVSAKRAESGGRSITVRLENLSRIPAVFIRLDLVAFNHRETVGQYRWNSVVPLKWSDNYVTLWPGEELDLEVAPMEGAIRADMLLVSGRNVNEAEILIF
ncbi:Exo-beta-D-glucosaminidase [Cytospora mali]|uniref:Exo-beta-D-glucosaminidase n=1 Tax=Cytospora mali TaxID=578113 RepID=A0A194US76_CYTMA|nr:Exo-beta-D-glucosaminidase [Valsa mali var. pyri (nom. inval.)]